MNERWWSMKLVLQTLRSEATAQHLNKAAARQPTSTIVSLPVPTVWYGWVWRHCMRVWCYFEPTMGLLDALGEVARAEHTHQRAGSA